MNSENVKLVVFVPISHADIVRETLGKAGAGKIGNYTFCSFSVSGYGRFLPEQGATPAIGEVGVFEKVEEERIEVVCPTGIIKDVIQAMKAAHPYEEIAYEVYPLLNFE